MDDAQHSLQRKLEQERRHLACLCAGFALPHGHGDEADNARDEMAELLAWSHANLCAARIRALEGLLGDLRGRPTIVFVGYRESVERVGEHLARTGFHAERYHGGMEQQWRERAVYKFRSGCSNVLVSTDLAARGLDIPEVEAVVHYHLPADRNAYVHRTGRTGRWEAGGQSYFLINPKEALPDYLDCQPEDYVPAQPPLSPVEPRWVTVYVGKGRKDKISKADLVGFFCKKGGLRAEDLGRIDVKDRYAYVSVDRAKVRAALRAVAGEKIKGLRTLVELMRH